jgi:UDP:flavonoid glycosyltransferase YjiC (YdhE family)
MSPEYRMTRKVVLATVGSLGDLHPFIAVGVALRERGVNAVIACAEDYRNKVEAAGLAFHALRPGFDEMQRDLGMNRAHLTREVIAHSAFMFRKLVLPYVQSAYEDMMAVTADADLVLPSSLAFAARLAAEKRGIPWIAVVLQPMMFLSAYDPPVISEAEALSALLRALGPTPARYTLWILKKVLNGLFRPLHALRADLGLARTAKNPLFDGQFSDAGAIGLYSRLLGEVRPDYPQPTSIVGFATFDSEDGRHADVHPALEAFLNAGPPPLVFTLGSLIVNSPGDFYEQGALAARALGRRAVLLVGEEAYRNFEHLQSPEVFVGAYAPHSLLFPRAAALVHHGGIGTLAQGLRSGRPQLIVPHFADQLDNAARARRLGVARILPPRRFRAASASRNLGGLLRDDGALARARKAAESVSAEHGAAVAARIVLDRLEHLRRK